MNKKDTLNNGGKTRIIIIRYGEVFLKGNNKDFFLSLLVKNIKSALKEFDYVFHKLQARYLISDYADDAETEILYRLKKVFGIYSLSTGYAVKTDMDLIRETALSLAPDIGSFRVTVNRVDSTVKQRSTDIAADIGGFVFSNKSGLSVDLFNFDTEINVDIRENGTTLVFIGRILAQGGLPVGSSGNGLLMLSGGIDSPVAGYMMAKRGMRICAVHFHSAPYTSEQAKEKVVDLAKIVSQYAGHIRLYVVPFTEIQLAIHEKCPSEFMITIMRRFMMRISERLARESDCGAIITGESLGQVASQTLQSINCTNTVAQIPVLRPLIGFDKSEIIDVARRIGSFETSILPYEDCCTIFLPKSPATKPKLEVVERAELAIQNAAELIEAAVTGVEIIKI
ncbi:MAG: tRNA 4-thiouridine(8) synthase ThiI [Clostridiaceae bacterium]|jgi:thiamine biosynthesis protein ThiI|nr:tRNA 4-thiouridine(8) synthase ThiI [Clostridiaceae bacterium]